MSSSHRTPPTRSSLDWSPVNRVYMSINQRIIKRNGLIIIKRTWWSNGVLLFFSGALLFLFVLSLYVAFKEWRDAGKTLITLIVSNTMIWSFFFVIRTAFIRTPEQQFDRQQGLYYRLPPTRFHPIVPPLALDRIQALQLIDLGKPGRSSLHIAELNAICVDQQRITLILLYDFKKVVDAGEQLATLLQLPLLVGYKNARYYSD